MLIVTAVIAAVIAAFATGTVVDSSTTPTALLEYSGQETDGNLESFDIKHEGGDTLSLDNLLIVIEPEGGYNTGITIPLKGDDLSVLGSSQKLVSAGDVIRVSIPSLIYSSLETGVIIEWSLSDIRTNGVLADGKFVVSNEEV